MNNNKTHFLLLYIIICVLSLLSCADNTHEEALHQAEVLMDAEQYEDALALLDSIDGDLFHSGSRQQARYALLYTKARYKNYIDYENDSLINIAVDYAEGHGDKENKFYAYLYQGIVRYLLLDYSGASFSLYHSLLYSDDIKDHYTKGQMYTYLAMVHGIQHCSDEDFFSQKAFHEYKEGSLEIYSISAMATKAVAKMHKGDYDSTRYWLDTCIVAANIKSDTFDLLEAKAAKANYYVLLDSLHQAQIIYQKLSNTRDYRLSVADYGNMALIYASQGDKEQADCYLKKAKQTALSLNDRATYWTKASHISRYIWDSEQIINSLDSLLYYQNLFLEQALTHTTIAVQRDFIDWQLQNTKLKHTRLFYFLFSLALVSIFVAVISIINNQKKQIQIHLQSEIIEKYQLQIKQQETTLANNLQDIKTSKIVLDLKDSASNQLGHHVEWDLLYSLFYEKMPLFEKTLKELTNLSEIEWRVCLLLKLGFTPSQIAFLVNKSAEGISSIRRRLYYKVFQQKGKAADWDKFIDTL